MKNFVLIVAFGFSLANLTSCSSAPVPTPTAAPLRTWTNSIGMRFVFIPHGTFRMGDPDNASSGDVIHNVKLSSFWMGQCEVTNAQFKLFKSKKTIAKFMGPTQPATPVDWGEARQFCQWLSKREGLSYRLPTEAEWEYGARGGLDQKKYPWGDEDPVGRANGLNHVTLPVGSFPPNAYGLYDMAGNVEEWVNDHYDPNYYGISPRVNPPGPAKADPKLTSPDEYSTKGTDWRVARGGSFGSGELGCADRIPAPLDVPNVIGSGFRVVLSYLPPRG